MEDVKGFSAFLHSIMRAAGFKDMSPRLRKVILGQDEEVTEEHRHLHHESGSSHSRVRHEWSQRYSRRTDQRDNSKATDEQTALLEDGGTHENDDNGSMDFAPLQSKVSGTSQSRVQQLAQQREETRAQMKDDEQEPLLVTRVRRDDGTEAEVIVGQSTLPQTIFNSSNTLIGVGLLSLPLAIRYTGWVIGSIALTSSSLITKYTAGLLAKCLDVDSSLANFADIAYVAFGEKGRVTTSALITLELTVGCVGLVILFADSLGAIIDGVDKVVWKVVAGCILAPLNFVPMRLLGYTSFLGIFCNLAIILVAFVMGLMKPESPGSLRDIATTYAFPKHWAALPLSFGLIMALWTGHSVFPNIYRDMRHPPKYAGCLQYVFGFVTFVDIAMAIIGYLLYGESVLDEITTSMIRTVGYPRGVKVLILILIAIMPITKFPLFAAPIVSTLEVFSSVDPRAALLRPNRFNQSKHLTRLLQAFFRLLVTIIAVVIAIVLPSFELISALMGGMFGFPICIIMPIAFHLRIFRDQIGKRQIFFDCTFILISALLGIVGTVWEFLPREWMGL